MKKVISIICLVTGIISFSTGVGILVVNENNRIKSLNALKDSIVNDYEDFKVKIEDFSTERTNVYENLNKISYLTDLSTNYNNLIAEYKKYEETLNEIETVSKDLKTNCFKEEFTETNINNKVSAFVINYEQAVNYFIQDVEKLNEKINSYNDWVENTQVTNTYQKLETYNSSFKEYVDINGDGEYNGIQNG